MSRRFIVFSFLLVTQVSFSQQWKIPANAPLLTRWGKSVDPARLLMEYPRPQMTRSEWMSLNGVWSLDTSRWLPAPGNRGVLESSQDPPAPILVPFPLESALSGFMKRRDSVMYRTKIYIPPAWRGKRILLHFGAVDWSAVITLNGRPAGNHLGGYEPFSLDITDKLTAGDAQELQVQVFDPTDDVRSHSDPARGKQTLKPEGIWYTSVTGIWQTVWLEAVPEVRIDNLHIVPDPEAKSVRVTVATAGGASGCGARITVFSNGKKVASAQGAPDRQIVADIPKPRLWSPEDPFLYDLLVELVRKDSVLDVVGSYFGMRSISIGADTDGRNRILLNGKPYFQIGPLDQGFWPDGIYTAPSDEALRSDVETMKRIGFNMVRKHVKVEPDRWYYWCDKLGLMVWQDMPSGQNNGTRFMRKQFEWELQRMIETHWNHPSIVMWVPFNEGWGEFEAERIAAMVKKWDPSRLVDNASGWVDKGAGDVKDVHNYPKPIAPAPDSARALVLGEFGGLGLGIDGHTWEKKHWGYQGMSDAEQLTRNYEEFLRKVYALNRERGLSAAVYTQLTDVETECNGLLTYDREILKPVESRIRAANRGDFSRLPPPPVMTTILPTSETEPQEWKYAFEQPSADWVSPGYDDSRWARGSGGFGTEGTPGAIVRTPWKGSDIWMRREVDLPDLRGKKILARVHHDEEAEIYVNGVQLLALPGYTTDYDDVPIPAPTQKGADLPFHTGKNLIAVHCHQTEGGQYIDIGLEEEMPGKQK